MRNRLCAGVVLAVILSGCGSASPAATTGTAGVATRATQSVVAESSVESESPSLPQSEPVTAAVTKAGTEAGTDAGTIAASNPLCDLFTTDEVEALLGASVGAGEDAAMSTGCQWNGAADATYLQIQVIDDPSYYVEESLGEGFQEVSGIGTAAFVIPEMGGWKASAKTDTATFAVAVNGGTASKESATTLLKQLVQRH